MFLAIACTFMFSLYRQSITGRGKGVGGEKGHGGLMRYSNAQGELHVGMGKG